MEGATAPIAVRMENDRGIERQMAHGGVGPSDRPEVRANIPLQPEPTFPPGPIGGSPVAGIPSAPALARMVLAMKGEKAYDAVQRYEASRSGG